MSDQHSTQRDHGNGSPVTCSLTPRHRRFAFTLVEVLVVISIIGVLAGLAIPAIGRAIATAKTTAVKMELNTIATDIEKYQQKYGDYPPDFSSAAVIQRHYQKVFPRILNNELNLLSNMLSPGGTFDATSMDRAEALVWCLGGYSDNVQRPFTGPGGPLVWIGSGTDTWEAPAGAMNATQINAARENQANYQINSDRVNQLHDFDLARLNFSTVNPSSTITGANRYVSTDDSDLFLTYAATDGGAPFVYFDSRTYDLFDPNVNGGAGDFNGYASTTFGLIRPYFSDQAVPNPNGTTDYATDAEALNAWRFVNPNTFQLISAGLDNAFGTVASFDVQTMDTDLEAVYFQYPTGAAIAPRTDVNTPGGLIISGVSGFQESSGFAGATIENFQLDNITNFSNAAIVDDVTE